MIFTSLWDWLCLVIKYIALCLPKYILICYQFFQLDVQFCCLVSCTQTVFLELSTSLGNVIYNNTVQQTIREKKINWKKGRALDALKIYMGEVKLKNL